MTEPQDQEVEVPVDLDLDAMGYEAVGKPVTVRIGGKVIHVAHSGDWTSSAMRASSMGDWDTWAREVIDDDDEYKLWDSFNLRNRQVEAVFAEVARQSNMNRGKSGKLSGQHPGSQRR